MIQFCEMGILPVLVLEGFFDCITRNFGIFLKLEVSNRPDYFTSRMVQVFGFKPLGASASFAPLPRHVEKKRSPNLKQLLDFGVQG
jgi:hypothetical protein